VRAALDDAVDQVLRYAGVNSPTAVPEFVRFAQVLVATDRDHAETGTVTAEPRHFAPWRTVAPVSEDRVREEVRKPASAVLTDQEILVAGMLRPAHLLDLVRDFTTRLGSGHRTVKLVGRHQQFKAVKALTRKLEERDRKAAAGVAVSHRGGVVWHTQGSGKSLTMAFLVRHLRSRPALKSHKVVVVTDRLDLEKQIRTSLAATEEKVHRAPSVKRARKYLEVDVGDVVLVTLQKAQRDDTAYDGREESLPDTVPDDDNEDGGEDEGYVQNRVANPHHHVVVLIDEAHRGQDKWQHARWRAMLPRAAFVGFTGTPVISSNRKRSEEIFGPYADTYTLRDAELDRSVVPVRYEAYAVPLDVIEQAALDARFDEKVPSDPELRAKVLRRFGRRKEILEAPSVIEAKAEHMLDHWARTALPDRFGAQIATVSRLAAVRYRTALLAARDRLVARLDALDPALIADPMAALEADDEERALLMLLPDREVLRTLDAAVVISPAGQGGSDPESWRPWITKSHQDAHIERFKKGLPPRDITADPAWNVRTHGLQPSGVGTPASGGQVWNVDLDLPADSGPPRHRRPWPSWWSSRCCSPASTHPSSRSSTWTASCPARDCCRRWPAPTGPTRPRSGARSSTTSASVPNWPARSPPTTRSTCGTSSATGTSPWTTSSRTTRARSPTAAARTGTDCCCGPTPPPRPSWKTSGRRSPASWPGRTSPTPATSPSGRTSSVNASAIRCCGVSSTNESVIS
jgi:type I restriction enzyme R subunit